MGNAFDTAVVEFIEARSQLLKAMYKAGINNTVLVDGTVVGWKENIGWDGVIYISAKESDRMMETRR